MTRYDRSGLEPRLEEMLQDPVVRLVMARDGVREGDVRAVVDAARSRLGAMPSGAAGFRRSFCCDELRLCA